MSTGSPLQLGPTERPVLRLNRRVIYVVGAVLIGAFLTGLIAIRAQGLRASEGSAQRRTALQPGSPPWFEGVPDQEPAAHPAALDPLPPPSTPLSSPRLVAARSSTEEPEESQQRRALRAAMSAPIGVAAFEPVARRTTPRGAARIARPPLPRPPGSSPERIGRKRKARPPKHRVPIPRARRSWTQRRTVSRPSTFGPRSARRSPRTR